jgi:hypothetical protein
MIRSKLLIIFLCSLPLTGFSQDLFWKANFNSFFDNTEFSQSKYKIPQTLTGLQIAPEAGLKWDSSHIIAAGANLVHNFGSKEQADFLYLTAYYEFRKNHYRFLMGSFPRAGTIERYPRIFFQDSVSYYRPNLNGIFWEITDDKYNVNLWLDWTSQISVTDREAFFMGFSGRYSINRFYLQHFGYIFHFSGDLNPLIDRGVFDNGLFLSTAGIDLSGLSRLDVADINAGYLVGTERDRKGENKWRFNSGFYLEAVFESKFAGIRNTLYLGEGQMNFYSDHGNELYWGDPVYRAGNHDRADFYIKFINDRTVDLRLTYSLHFAEGRVFHEQMLKASVNLSNLK